ncbi:hypothetical protein P5673_019075, partial [Acropora cervicornis]
ILLNAEVIMNCTTAHLTSRVLIKLVLLFALPSQLAATEALGNDMRLQWLQRIKPCHIPLDSLSAPRPSPTVKHISFQKFNTLDLNAFKDDIAQSDLSHDADPEKLGDLYNNTLRLRLDRQITSKKVLFRPSVPRKAERKWRSTR